MLEGDLVYSVISPVVGVLGAGMGLYVILKNPYLETARAFFLLMMLFLVAGLYDFFLMNSPNEVTATGIGRVVLALIVLIYGGMLYLSSLLPYERRTRWLSSHKIEFLVILAVAAVVPAAMVDQAVRTSYGWGIPDSPAMNVLLVIVLVLIFMALGMLFRTYRSSRSRSVKRQSVLLGAGIVFPLFHAFILVISDYFGVYSPPILSAGFLVTSVVFLYAILRHKLFIIEPVSEERKAGPGPREGKDRVEISKGGSYLIESKRPDPAYAVFTSEVGKGSKGLLISRTHPDTIKERYGLVKTPIVWLASQPGPDRVEPANLSILQHTISEFLKKGEDVIVMLDGLEYLISNNPIEKVLRLIYSIRDEVVLSDSKFIIPVDPDVLYPNHLALFERELEVVRSGGAGTEI